jgi:flavin reductase (DIM6/NTAB) family NADH-FMN oxidoreductase RutF
VSSPSQPGAGPETEPAAPLLADPSPVDAGAFRAAMAAVAAPVSVVTVLAGDRPHGSTVSSFTSLSLDPPMVLVSLDRSSDLLARIRRYRVFGINVLAADQAALASAFARKGDDKFSGVDWALDAGAPRLPGCAGWVACHVRELVPGGDHVLVLALVTEAGYADVPPLTYHQRTFGTHRTDPGSDAAPAPGANVRYLRPRPGAPAGDARPLPVSAAPGDDDYLEDWFAFN